MGERFGRTALVRLDDDTKSALLSRSGLGHEVLERDDALGGAAALGLAIQALAALRDLARLHRILDDDELITGHRHSADAEDLRRNRRASVLDVAATLIEQRADASRVHAAD